MTAHADVLAPDLRLRAPLRPLRSGTVDCHAHIFDRFERYPLAGTRKYSPPRCTRESWLACRPAALRRHASHRANAARRAPRSLRVGTNWPHPGLTTNMPNDADLLDLLESWLPGDSVRAPLFAQNAARLYRFRS